MFFSPSTIFIIPFLLHVIDSIESDGWSGFTNSAPALCISSSYLLAGKLVVAWRFLLVARKRGGSSCFALLLHKTESLPLF